MVACVRSHSSEVGPDGLPKTGCLADCEHQPTCGRLHWAMSGFRVTRKTFARSEFFSGSGRALQVVSPSWR
jgi:hypothetical protein